MNNMNTLTAADDLLARMMMVNPDNMSKRCINENMNKFRSAIIFQGLINRNMIVGRTNQEVYDLYCDVAKDMSIEPLSIIDFTRTLSKYYGYKPHSVTIEGKTKRVFRVNERRPKGKDTMTSLQSQVHYISRVKTKEQFLGQRNTEAYEEYLTWCRENFQPVASKVTFSRMVTTIHNIQVKSVTRNRTTFRIYAELEGGEDHGDNTPGQAGLG